MSHEVISVPMIGLRGIVILPEMVTHFDVSKERSVKAVEEAMLEDGQKLFLTVQKNRDAEEPKLEDFYEMGTLAAVKQVVKLPKNIVRVLIVGETRARLRGIRQEGSYIRADVAAAEDTEKIRPEFSKKGASPNLEAMLRGLKEIYAEYVSKHPKYPKEMAKQISEYQDLKKLVDTIAANVPLDYKDLQEILEETDVWERYRLLTFKLVNELQILEIKEDIQVKLKERVDKNQREYILREQLKFIREELGEDNTISDAEEFKAAAKKLKAPKEVKEKLLKEIGRFKNSAGSPAESGVLRTYIETMLEMPWDKAVKDHKDIAFAKRVLDEDHYGLERVKERMLEFLAVRALTKKGNSPILCLVGPPGTGKTSIAKSLARALKRPYVRISLGGVRDEAEIRGHRKTYVGAIDRKSVV